MHYHCDLTWRVRIWGQLLNPSFFFWTFGCITLLTGPGYARYDANNRIWTPLCNEAEETTKHVPYQLTVVLFLEVVCQNCLILREANVVMPQIIVNVWVSWAKHFESAWLKSSKYEPYIMTLKLDTFNLNLKSRITCTDNVHSNPISLTVTTI